MKPTLTCLLSFVLLTTGCDQADEPVREQPAGEQPSAAEVPADLFVDTAPADSRSVSDVRASAKAGEEVVLRGKIGGRDKPFVGEKAMFVVVDETMQPCPPDEGCPTPWDYCCLPPDEIAAKSATIQVARDGKVLAKGLEGVHGLAPLAEVVVSGTVTSTDGGLVVDAKRIHVAAR